MDRYPGKIWVVSPQASRRCGRSRQDGHSPQCDSSERLVTSFCLGTVLVDADISEDSSPLDYNPSWSAGSVWRLAPWGRSAPTVILISQRAIRTTTGSSWAGSGTGSRTIEGGRNAVGLPRPCSDPETASMWQSLGFGPNFKAAYCMAVCPAGEDVIGPFLQDRKGFLEAVVNPLQGERGNALCFARLGCSGARVEAVPAQNDQSASAMSLPAPVDSRLPASACRGLLAESILKD